MDHHTPNSIAKVVDFLIELRGVVAPALDSPDRVARVVGDAPHRAYRLLEEVIVTAQKRDDQFQEVPPPVTAFNELQKALEELGLQTQVDVASTSICATFGELSVSSPEQGCIEYCCGCWPNVSERDATHIV